MRYLGLDASKTATGWAVFSEDGLVSSGVLKCPVKRTKGVSGIEAAYSGAVGEWIRSQVRALVLHWEVTHAVIEEPLHSSATSFTTDATIHLSNVVFSACAMAASALSVPVWSVNQGTWRSDMGVKRAPKGTSREDRTRSNKEQAIAMCRWHGIDPRSHDEAEAILIAKWLQHQLDPRMAIADAPLFSGRPHAERAAAWAKTSNGSSGSSRTASRT